MLFQTTHQRSGHFFFFKQKHVTLFVPNSSDRLKLRKFFNKQCLKVDVAISIGFLTMFFPINQLLKNRWSDDFLVLLRHLDWQLRGRYSLGTGAVEVADRGTQRFHHLHIAQALDGKCCFWKGLSWTFCLNLKFFGFKFGCFFFDFQCFFSDLLVVFRIKLEEMELKTLDLLFKKVTWKTYQQTKVIPGK